MKVPKTKGVLDLVSEVLRSFPEPLGEDVIEDVCIAIESNPRWRRRYDELVGTLGKWVVNSWIGKYVRDIAAMKGLRQVAATRTRLVKSYRKLMR